MATGSGAKRAAKNREVSLRKETEVQCGIVRLLYEDGSLSVICKLEVVQKSVAGRFCCAYPSEISQNRIVLGTKEEAYEK